jgi:arylsulfatase A-like enzyme
VPFLVRYPGLIPRDATDGRFAANIDIAPTALEAADLPDELRLAMDGRSLLGDEKRSIMFTEHFGNPVKNRPTWASIRTRRYQYVEYYSRFPSGEDEFVNFREYYDLRNDPFQLVNLYEDGDATNDPNAVPLEAITQDARDCAGSDCP